MNRKKIESEQTRKEILDVALEQMLEKGFSATSIKDICESVGITKGGLFHHFKNKDELGQALVYHYWEPMRTFFEGDPLQEIDDPLERIFLYCDLIAGQTETAEGLNYCLFGKFAQELTRAQLPVSLVVEEGFVWWLADIEKYIHAALLQYETLVPITARQLAEQFIVTFEGALLLARATQNFGILRQQLELYKQSVALYFGQVTTPKTEKNHD